MKKWLIILGIITCMAGLTACGEKEQDMSNIMSEDEAKNLVQDWASTLNDVVIENQKSDFVTALSMQNGWDASVLEGAVDSWESSAEELGNYGEILEITANSMTYEQGFGMDGVMHTWPVTGTVSAKIKCGKHDAEIEIVYKDTAPVSVSTNVDYTFGESMARAGLNTLLGMGTVFAVLILISFIIAAFGLIPKLFEPKKPVENKKADDIVSQIAEREELSDDTELVAVISAAIAAYEGSGSTDGFVVRSIRKTRNSKWQNA
ncbi:MAG: OadG family protein [Lachnospiraceae bacterium]|nr:OadG family protein [Lachnospiraceae bacterium]